MTERILKIDYAKVAAHLSERLNSSQDPDILPHQLCFKSVHGILTGLLRQYEEDLDYPFKEEYVTARSDEEDGEHLTEQPDDMIVVETQALTDILFEDLGNDSFEDAVISNTPGVVMWYKESPVVLPLVIIKVT